MLRNIAFNSLARSTNLVRSNASTRPFFAFKYPAFKANQSSVANDSSAEEIRSLIAQNSVFVASKSFCPFCHRAKQLLKDLNVEHKVVELDEVSNGNQLQQALKELSGQSTVPNIYIKGTHIGGNSDLQKLNSSGMLIKMLGKSKL
ncbi:glutaredoxin [Nadsonia fulvescens var. elongata DSM 6958]|uniref:Glutaredoxin n=1 Tax=Nadsonia fulvescens var. elongata DSM 6958 TaxID=857566 RepID=A0A1E3PE38_9ASCO|nr:glutaredoxin [Nadsonia fulvescens var. elongata DSM 6958]